MEWSYNDHIMIARSFCCCFVDDERSTDAVRKTWSWDFVELLGDGGVDDT